MAKIDTLINEITSLYVEKVWRSYYTTLDGMFQKTRSGNEEY